jgi:hypothetical protein
MKTSKWYVRHKEESLGPYTVEELQTLAVTTEDYVWTEGMSEWIQAKHVTELEPFVQQKMVPPPFHGVKAQEQEPAKKLIQEEPTVVCSASTKRVRLFGWRSVVVIAIILIIGYYMAGQYSGPSISSFSTPAEDTEHVNPGDYLTAEGKYWKNLIDQWVVEGTIMNTASHTNYKDVVLRVNFYSETESLIESKDFVLYKFFPYGDSQDYKLKMEYPHGAKSCGVEAVDGKWY